MKPLPIADRLVEVLTEIWRATVTVKSTYAREHAEYVAMAASMGLITTRVGPNTYAGAWQCTGKGIRHINDNEDED